MSSQPWDVPEREITPKKTFLTRRRVLALGIGAGTAAAASGGFWWWYRGGFDSDVVARGRVDLSEFINQREFYPATLNRDFEKLDRSLTDRVDAARYCNFYELSGNKAVWRYVDSFKPVPWTLTVDGLVDRKLTLDVGDLHRTFPLEERRYRHRCVETWAMAVPWTGFPLHKLLHKAGLKNNARYVRFTTFHDTEMAPRQHDDTFEWPYTEGLTIREALNELTLLATGIYGEPLLKQHGAPVRLVVPWKYGFKSAKSLTRIEVTDKRPATFWTSYPTPQTSEYTFEANVNPNVAHPRWSQRTEKLLTTGERRPTQIYNGYGEWVGGLYKS